IRARGSSCGITGWCPRPMTAASRCCWSKRVKQPPARARRSTGAIVGIAASAIAGALLVDAPMLQHRVAALSQSVSDEPYTPARLRGGDLPSTPVQAVGPGQVYLELAVTSAGAVSAVKTLRATPPFTEPLAAAVAAWRFRPAEEEMSAPDPEGSAPP